MTTDAAEGLYQRLSAFREEIRFLDFGLMLSPGAVSLAIKRDEFQRQLGELIDEADRETRS